MGTKPIIEGAVRKDGWTIAPERLTIPGLDNKDYANPLHQAERIKLSVKESLVLSCMDSGLVKSVPVYRPKGVVPARLEVIDGVQGVRAAREANKRFAKQGNPKRVVCDVVLKDGTPAELISMSNAANHHRQDDSMIVQRLAVRHALKHGSTEAQIATSMGLSITAIKDLVTLDKLPEPVLDAVREKRITASKVVKPTFARELTAEQQVDVVKEAPGPAVIRATQKLLSDTASDEAKQDGVEAVERALGKKASKKLASAKPPGKIGGKEFAKRVARAKGEEARVLPNKKQWRELLKYMANGGAADLAGGGARRNGFALCVELITGTIKISDVPGFKKALKNIGFEA